jgi:phage FluMu protein Com
MIKLRCINCNEILQRVDFQKSGFCSPRCKKIYQGIKKLKQKDLRHIVYWYYVQRKYEYEKQIKNKKARSSLRKLLDELESIFECKDGEQK